MQISLFHFERNLILRQRERGRGREGERGGEREAGREREGERERRERRERNTDTKMCSTVRNN